MGSQLDLDQGGTFREWERVYLGPSVGWTWAPRRNVLLITAAGTYVLVQGVSLVQVNIAGAVILTLPSAILPTDPPAGALPGPFVHTPITIVDIGGFANANPITIHPASGAENIMGLASITLNSNYGGYVLNPSSLLKGWTTAP